MKLIIIIVIVFVLLIPIPIFAEVTITPAAGSGAPGCEQSRKGCFIPYEVTVDVGEKIIFSNTDNAPHTFTSGSVNEPTGLFDSGLLETGETFEFVFNESGVYPYYDMVHPWMNGVVNVGIIYSHPIEEIKVTESSDTNQLEIPAPFVDKTKNPQSYVDRYFNEATYKEWFDSNYPEYYSIYQGVGLEDPPPREITSQMRSQATIWCDDALDRHHEGQKYDNNQFAFNWNNCIDEQLRTLQSQPKPEPQPAKTADDEYKMICSGPDGYCMNKVGMTNPEAYGSCIERWVPFCRDYQKEHPDVVEKSKELENDFGELTWNNFGIWEDYSMKWEDGDFLDSWQFNAQEYEMINDFKNAAWYYQKAAEEDSRYNFQLSMVYGKMTEYEKALETYSIYINEFDSDREKCCLQFREGIFYYHLGDYSKAKTIFYDSIDSVRESSLREQDKIVHMSTPLIYLLLIAEKENNSNSISEINELFNQMNLLSPLECSKVYNLLTSGGYSETKTILETMNYEICSNKSVLQLKIIANNLYEKYESPQVDTNSDILCGTGTIEKNGQCVPDHPNTEPSSKGGGCLIATATYGSELAPQVQQLRELRDNALLQTESGIKFMNTFNDVYYSFSPIIADYERENPIFKEMVKVVITPMKTSLSILNYMDMDSESEVLGYGIGVIILNGMMYVGFPVLAMMRLKKNRF